MSSPGGDAPGSGITPAKRATADGAAALAPKRRHKAAEGAPQPPPEPQLPPGDAGAPAAETAAAPPPRPRLWVPPAEAAAVAAAAAAAVPAPPPGAASSSTACDICGASGAWASHEGIGAEALQPLCAACRKWRRFPRVGAHANITPQALPRPAAAPP